jgi:TatD DNase family protein
VWIGRGRNSPAELPRIAQTLAELRGIDLDTVARATTLNARSLFRLD